MDGESGLVEGGRVHAVEEARPEPVAAMYIPLVMSDSPSTSARHAARGGDSYPHNAATAAKAEGPWEGRVGAVAVVVRHGSPFSADEISAAEWCAQCGAAGVFTLASLLRSKELLGYMSGHRLAGPARSRSSTPPRTRDEAHTGSSSMRPAAVETPAMLRARRAQGAARVWRKNAPAEVPRSEERDSGDMLAATAGDDQQEQEWGWGWESRDEDASESQQARSAAATGAVAGAGAGAGVLASTSRLLAPTAATIAHGTRHPARGSLTAARSLRATRGNWRHGEERWRNPDDEEEEEEAEEEEEEEEE